MSSVGAGAMLYAFGDCELDEELCELRRGGVPVKLEPKAFRGLAYLIQHRDRVVPKDELLDKLWPGEFVTDSALIRSIAKARQAVSDDGGTQRVIRTVHRHGYRFVAAIEARARDAAKHFSSAVHPTSQQVAELGLSVRKPQAEQPPAGSYTPEGEYKPVTILVAGVTGMTTLAQRIDPERLDEVLNRLFDLLRVEVQRVEGVVSHVSSEWLSAVFGAPIAQKDHTVRALHAALWMQRGFAPLAADIQRTYGVTLALRLGVHSGTAMVSPPGDEGRPDYTVQGLAMYVANRLQALAPDDTICSSETVRQQAAGFFHFTDLREFKLPEVSQPMRIYACTNVDQASSRLEAFLGRHTSAFLGREREMDLLHALWAKACRGYGQVVCLFGEAGVGKSRLAYEFQRTLVAARTLQAQTLSYGQAMPYHMFVPLLRALIPLHEGNHPQDQRQQIRTRLHALHPKLAEDEPWLSDLLGVPLQPEQRPDLPLEERKRRLQNVCLQLIVQHALDKPFCLLLEDLHWLDPSSREVLDLLVAALTRRPILLLGTARLGFRHTWDDLTYYHRLTVEPLADAHSDRLIGHYFQPYDAAPALKALTRGRTGGNPFFLEEMLRVLKAHQLIALQDGIYVLKAGAHVEMSASVHGVLAARIDRLPSEAKHLLQTVAVIGTEVPFSLIQAVAELSEEELRRHLAQLQTAAFLFEARRFPDLHYTFTHALTHEVTYGGLCMRGFWKPFMRAMPTA